MENLIKNKSLFPRNVFQLLLLMVVLLLTPAMLSATHIVGGSMSYTCLGNDQYEVTLVVRRDCLLGADNAPFDNPASIGIFGADGQLLTSLGTDGELRLPFRGDEVLSNEIEQICFANQASICVHITKYSAIVTLPNNGESYTLAHQRCCRNSSLNNVVNPLETGMTLFIELTPASMDVCNSSPIFNFRPDVFVCVGEALSFDGSATDADGDLLVYKICTPFAGATKEDPRPQPPSAPPYNNIEWVQGFGPDNLLGGQELQQDGQGAMVNGVPGFVGQYLVGLCVEEYRDGVLLSVSHREFQYNVVNCNDEIVADFNVTQSDCGLENVQFENTSQTTDAYTWFFDYPSDDPAFISQEESPTFSYPEAGTYTVRLVAENTEVNCESIKEQHVTILDGTTTQPFSTTILSCSGGQVTVRLTDVTQIETSDRSWVVSINGNEIVGSSQNIEFQADTADEITAKLTIAGSTGCQIEVERQVDVNYQNAVNFQVNYNRCNDRSVELDFIDDTALIGGLVPADVEWIFVKDNEADIMASGLSTTQSFLENDVILVTQTVTYSNGCQASSQQLLDLALEQLVSFETDLVQCYAGRRNMARVAFISTGELLPINNLASQWEWTVINGDKQLSFSGDNTIELDLDFTDPVIVSLTTSFTNGCSATTERIINLNELLQADVTIMSEYTPESCDGDEVTVIFSNDTPQIDDWVSTIIQKAWRITSPSGIFTDEGNVIRYTGPRGERIQVSYLFVGTNGCQFEQLLEFTLDPFAEDGPLNFEYEILNCSDGEVDIRLIDTSSAEMTTWYIKVNDEETIRTGSPLDITFNEDDVVRVSLEGFSEAICEDPNRGNIVINPDNNIEYRIDYIDCPLGQIELQFVDVSPDIGGITKGEVSWVFQTSSGATTSAVGSSTVQTFNENDVLIIMQSIAYDNDCSGTLIDTINLDFATFLSYDTELVSCDGPNLFTVTLNADANDLPPSTANAQLFWFITNGDNIFNTDGPSVTAQLDFNQPVEVELAVSYRNRCTYILSELLTFDDIFGDTIEAQDDVEIIITPTVCVGDNITTSISNQTTIVSGGDASVVSRSWMVSGDGIDGVITDSSTEIIIEGMAGDIINIKLELLLSNGCEITIEERYTIKAVDFTLADDFPDDGEDDDGSSGGGDDDSMNGPNDLDSGGNTIIICDGVARPLVEDADPDATYEWNPTDGLTFPDGDLSNPLALPSSPTTYIVTATNGGCVTIDSVRVIPIEDVEISIVVTPTDGEDGNNGENGDDGNDNGTENDICNGNLLLTASGGSGVYEWSLDPSFITLIGTGQSIDIMQDAAEQTYYVRSLITEDCYSSTFSIDISLEGGAASNFDSDILSCDGDQVNVRLTDRSGATNTSWVLTINGTEVSRIGSPLDLTLDRDDMLFAKIDSDEESICPGANGKIVIIDPDELLQFRIDYIDCPLGQVEVQFVDISPSLNGDRPQRIDWVFQTQSGETISATGNSTVQSFTELDAITVMMSAQYPNGCSATLIKDINLDFATFLDFFSNLVSCDGPNLFTVDFSALTNDIPSSDSPVELSWFITNGDNIFNAGGLTTQAQLDFNQPIEVNLAVQYNGKCIYTLTRTLTLDDVFGDDIEADDDVDIIIRPTACDDEAITTSFSNTTTILLGGDATVTSRSWMISGDGIDGIITDQSTEVIIEGKTGDTIDIKLELGLSNGCQLTIEKTHIVRGVDIILADDFPNDEAGGGTDVGSEDDNDLDNGGNTIVICDGQPRPLVENPDPNATYEWNPTEGLDFPDGDTSNPLAFPDGTITYVVTVTNGNCITIDSVKVIPIDDVVIIIDVTSTGENGDNDGDGNGDNNGDGEGDGICDGNITLTASGGSGLYEWSLDTSFSELIGTGVSIDVVQDNAVETYYVRSLIYEGCYSSTFSSEVILDDGAGSNFDADIISCDEDQVTVRLTDRSGVSNTAWIVTINGQEETRSGSPLDIILNREDELFARIDTDDISVCPNGNGKTVVVNPDDNLEYGIRYIDCPEGQVQLEFFNESPDLAGQAPERIDWVFQTSSGITTNGSGVSTLQTFSEDDLITVMMTAQYANGCTATLIEEVDLDFGQLLDFNADLISCDDENLFTVELSALTDDIPISDTPIEVSWSIRNGSTAITANGVLTTAQLNFNQPVEISLSARYNENCEYTVTRPLTFDDVFGDGIDAEDDVDITITPTSCEGEDITVSISNQTTVVLDGDADVISKNWMITTMGGSDVVAPTQINTCSDSDLTSIVGQRVNGLPGEIICVPFNGFNFTDITSIQTAFRWDPSLLSYSSIRALALDDIDVNEAFVSTGELRFVWLIGLGVSAVTVNDNTELFEICFELVGDVGQEAAVTMTSFSSLDIEVSNDDLELLDICLQPATVGLGQETTTPGGTMIMGEGDEISFTGQEGEMVDIKLTLELDNGCVLILRETYTVEKVDIDILDEVPSSGDVTDDENGPGGSTEDGPDDGGLNGDGTGLTEQELSTGGVNDGDDLSGNTVILCPGESKPLVTNPNPDYTYEWSPEDGLVFDGEDRSNPLASPTSQTTYRVTVTNGDCVAEEAVTVIPISDYEIPIFGATTICGEQTVLLEVPDVVGSRTEWSTDADFATVLSVGPVLETTQNGNQTYYVRQLFGAGCVSSIQSVTIEQLSISIDGVIIDPVTNQPTVASCTGSTTSLSATTNGDSNDIEWINAATGEVIGTGMTLEVNPEDIESIIARISAGDDCVRMTAETSFVPYDLNDDISLEDSDIPGVVCVGQDTQLSISMETSSALSFIWSPESCIVAGGRSSTPIINLTANKDLILTITNLDNGCTDDLVFPIAISENVVFEVMGDRAICDENVSLSVSDVAGASAEWSSDPDFNNIIAEGDELSVVQDQPSMTYYVRQAIAGGCFSEAQEIEVMRTMILIDGLNEMNNTLVFCDPAVMTITASSTVGAENIMWYNAATDELIATGSPIEIDPNEINLIYAIVEGDSGCQVRTENIMLTPFDLSSIIDLNLGEVGGIPNGLCAGEDTQINITNTTGDSLIYEWGPPEVIISGGNTSSPVINSSADIELTLRVVDLMTGCESMLNVPLPVSELESDLFADPSADIFLGSDVTLIPESNVDNPTYQWSTGETTETITVMPTEDTEYSVTITDENGCSVVETILITVMTDCSESGIYLPNAFTPNGDGNNDVLFVRSNSLMDVELIIYDRWGREVFQTTSLDVGWNGQWQNTGEELAPDAYGYHLRATCFTGEEYSAKGNVSILR